MALGWALTLLEGRKKLEAGKCANIAQNLQRPAQGMLDRFKGASKVEKFAY
jgi:hypothetical protein